MAKKTVPTLLTNARIFTSLPNADKLIPGCVIIDNGVINHVGHDASTAVALARSSGAVEIDVAGQVITPSFIDSHVHIMHFGLSLSKLDVLGCTTLSAIRDSIRAFAAAHPDEKRVLCKGWIQSSTGGQPLASMLDDLDPRPIYVEAMDLHSVWCNTAALRETGVLAMKADPDGGKIHRNENGTPTGLLEESALHGIVVPFLMGDLSAEERQVALAKAVSAFTAAGYTGAIDMAMDAQQWGDLVTYRRKNGLDLHVAAHWLIPYSEDEEEVQRYIREAVQMHGEYNPATSPDFCIMGIKLIGDGTVDGCTAGLTHSYGALTDPVEPFWAAERLASVVQQADAAGLQCAIHAIGDRTIKEAIDAIAALRQPNRRHRIEHLELASTEDARRLGQLGIVASVQPVHSDPVLFRAWPTMLGTHRCKRAFPYRDFLDGNASVVFGTDTPTAAHFPLPNLYNATTRKSAIEPSSDERTNPQFAVPLVAAIKAATAGAAYSRYAETWTGTLQKGMSADLVVLETDWTPDGLLASKVKQTWYKGRRVFNVDT